MITVGCIYVACDCCSVVIEYEPTRIYPGRSLIPSWNANAAINGAKRDGWYIYTGVAYCPDCALIHVPHNVPIKARSGVE